MIPRPYQKRLVDRAEAALRKHGDTLSVAATGAGKTIMLAMLGGRIGGRQLVLQHRQELVSQNLTKYRKVNPDARPSLYTAGTKSMRGDCVFAMAQTLARNLERIPKLDLLILDEAHHAAAPTWRAIVEAARAANPDILVAGFTATPERGDSRSLRGVFSNVADVITIRELVQQGFLVPPKAYVVDVGGTQEALREIGQVSDYFDQATVEAILNTVAVNDEVVRHWREKAGDRQTIVFASTVQHAQDVSAAFLAAGVTSACIHGAMADGGDAVDESGAEDLATDGAGHIHEHSPDIFFPLWLVDREFPCFFRPRLVPGPSKDRTGQRQAYAASFSASLSSAVSGASSGSAYCSSSWVILRRL